MNLITANFGYFALCSLVLFCLGCNNQEVEELQTQNQLLKAHQEQRDSVMDAVIKAYEIIDSNNTLIQSREKNIKRMMTRQHRSLANKDSILMQIGVIDSLSAENQTLASELDSSISSSPFKVLGVKQIVGSLHEKNSHSTEEVGALKGKLATISEDFRALFEEFAVTEANRMRLEENNSALAQSNSDLQANNERLVQKLNEAWYATGSKAELKEKGLLDKKGVLVNRKLNEELNKKFFQRIDIRNFNTMTLNAKKALLITPHPPASYRFTGTKRKVEKIVIKDIDEFWSVSRYLLIEVEK